MSKFWELIKRVGPGTFDILLGITIIYIFMNWPATKESMVLKDFKDGIQNHLVWSNKGECFYVRPNDENTTYLIRVTDCDRK